MHNHLHKSLFTLFKQLIADTLWDKVNAVNFGVFMGTIYGQLAIILSISAWTTDAAWWVQFLLAVIAALFLIAYNALKLYRLWKKQD